MLSHTRGIFHHTSTNSNSNHTCPSKETIGPAIVPFVGDLTYHQFSTTLSGACALLSALIVGVLIVTHAINYSNPVQQRQVIRIVLLIPWVALFSFLIVWRVDAGEYLVESLDFGCSIALSSFLLFMCDLVLSHRGGFDDLFGRHAWSKGAFEGDSPKVLKVCDVFFEYEIQFANTTQRMWYGVLQFIPTSIIIWIATATTLAAGVFCKQSNSPHFAHIWIAVLKFIVTSIAIISCLRFYSKHKAKLLEHKILLKLFTFKGIIGLNVLQSVSLRTLSLMQHHRRTVLIRDSSSSQSLPVKMSSSLRSI